VHAIASQMTQLMGLPGVFVRVSVCFKPHYSKPLRCTLFKVSWREHKCV